MTITSYIEVFESLVALYQSAPEKFLTERDRIFSEFISGIARTSSFNTEHLEQLHLLLNFHREESTQGEAINESLHLLRTQCEMLFSKLDALNELTNKFQNKKKAEA